MISLLGVCSPCSPLAAGAEPRYLPSETAATSLPSACQASLSRQQENRHAALLFQPALCRQQTPRRWQSVGKSSPCPRTNPAPWQEKPPGSAPGQVSLSPTAPAAHSPTYSPAPPLLSSRCRGRSQLDPTLPPSPPAEAAARAGREPRSHFETCSFLLLGAAK